MNNIYPFEDHKERFIETQTKVAEGQNWFLEDFLHTACPLRADMQPCLVQEELETVARLVANKAGKRQVTLIVLPPTTPVVVKADGEKLRQAFLYILINSLQATSPGGSVTISTTVDQAARCAICFRDTGPGMDAAKIFEGTKPDGTRLGLAITRKTIESHGGTVLVESRGGDGVAVTVRFPMNGATQ